MGNLVDQLKAFFDSDEGKEYIRKEQEEILFKSELKKRYIDKVHSMSIKDRDILFQKIKTKYDSDAYRDREYKLGYEPREMLYSYILEYAQKYGIPYQQTDMVFPYESYAIDGWSITIIFGQGCAYIFERRDNSETIKLRYDKETKSVILTDSYGRSVWYDDERVDHPIRMRLSKYISGEYLIWFQNIYKENGSLHYINLKEGVSTTHVHRTLRNFINERYDGFVESFEDYGLFEDWMYNITELYVKESL